MDPLILQLGVAVGIGMAAGHISGKHAADKHAQKALGMATAMMMRVSSSLANGAIEVLTTRGGMTEIEAMKALMEAAGKRGFAGAILNKLTGEITHVNAPKQE